MRYRLQYRGEGGAPYRLTAYLTLKRMLRDVRSGRLDAALLEGQELAGALDARPVMAAAVLGRRGVDSIHRVGNALWNRTGRD